MRIQGIDTTYVQHIRSGGTDANGQPAVRTKAIGLANPCRHCLRLIAEGDDMLILSYRPFKSDQPYAERGPIFLHAEACDQYNSDQTPPWFAFLDPAAVRGYDARDWIRYDTGQIVPGGDIANICSSILNDESIAYVHVRSKFGCFQCEATRG